MENYVLEKLDNVTMFVVAQMTQYAVSVDFEDFKRSGEILESIENTVIKKSTLLSRHEGLTIFLTFAKAGRGSKLLYRVIFSRLSNIIDEFDGQSLITVINLLNLVKENFKEKKILVKKIQENVSFFL